MNNPLSWISTELTELEQLGLRRHRREIVPLPNGRCRIDGRELWNFAGNDYLNLAQDSRVVAAAQQAAQEAGAGATASPLICGRTQWHVRLEHKLADFEGTESAILFPTGFAANMGVVTSVVGRDDALFSDRLNHASLVDGCRLSKAALTIYDRQDLPGFKRALTAASHARRRLIVTDSIFSMDGDAAPLEELCDLAETHDALLLIDEAHATGIYGKSGRGMAESMGVEDRVHFRVGTLSKALGASGGFVCGSADLIDWLWNNARTQIFSTALSPPACAAAYAALEIIEAEPQRREMLLRRSQKFREQIAAAEFQTIDDAFAPIVPLLLDNPRLATDAAAALEKRGYLVAAIRPPSVPPGTCRLRITLSSAHDDAAVGGLLAALREVLQGARTTGG